jgi:arsenate reductase-like glutaredoxin family protein
MNKIKIYHNTNCSKSKGALELILEKMKIKVIEYLTQRIKN